MSVGDDDKEFPPTHLASGGLPLSGFSASATGSKDPLIGTSVSGYVVKGKLGQGGMGIVYEGEQPMIGKRVAIKVLRAEIAQDPEQVQRLVSEARAVNAVGHRGIVDVFGYGELSDGRHCIVMEYLDGEPLSDLLIRNRREHRATPVLEVLLILEEILSALGAAHGAGVIHRDLKPSNIFLCKQRDGSRYVKVIDFGIAKLGVIGSTPSTRASMLIGTPSYMAPEQARGGAVSAALDLYAVGIIAFEMLTGQLPFNGDNVVAVLMQHAEAPVPKPSSLLLSIPDAMDDVVLKLLQKNPIDRFQSAEEVRIQVVRVRKGLSVSTGGRSGLDMLLPKAGAQSLADQVHVETMLQPLEPQPGQQTVLTPSLVGLAAHGARPTTVDQTSIGTSLPMMNQTLMRPSSVDREALDYEQKLKGGSGKTLLFAGLAAAAIAVGVAFALREEDPPSYVDLDPPPVASMPVVAAPPPSIAPEAVVPPPAVVVPPPVVVAVKPTVSPAPAPTPGRTSRPKAVSGASRAAALVTRLQALEARLRSAGRHDSDVDLRRVTKFIKALANPELPNRADAEAQAQSAAADIESRL